MSSWNSFPLGTAVSLSVSSAHPPVDRHSRAYRWGHFYHVLCSHSHILTFFLCMPFRTGKRSRVTRLSWAAPLACYCFNMFLRRRVPEIWLSIHLLTVESVCPFFDLLYLMKGDFNFNFYGDWWHWMPWSRFWLFEYLMENFFKKCFVGVFISHGTHHDSLLSHCIFLHHWCFHLVPWSYYQSSAF